MNGASPRRAGSGADQGTAGNVSAGRAAWHVRLASLNRCGRGERADTRFFGFPPKVRFDRRPVWPFDAGRRGPCSGRGPGSHWAGGSAGYRGQVGQVDHPAYIIQLYEAYKERPLVQYGMWRWKPASYDRSFRKWGCGSSGAENAVQPNRPPVTTQNRPTAKEGTAAPKQDVGAKLLPFLVYCLEDQHRVRVARQNSSKAASACCSSPPVSSSSASDHLA